MSLGGKGLINTKEFVLVFTGMSFLFLAIIGPGDQTMYTACQEERKKSE
jgi:hypothetical protein